MRPPKHREQKRKPKETQKKQTANLADRCRRRASRTSRLVRTTNPSLPAAGDADVYRGGLAPQSTLTGKRPGENQSSARHARAITPHSRYFSSSCAIFACFSFPYPGRGRKGSPPACVRMERRNLASPVPLSRPRRWGRSNTVQLYYAPSFLLP